MHFLQEKLFKILDLPDKGDDLQNLYTRLARNLLLIGGIGSLILFPIFWLQGAPVGYLSTLPPMVLSFTGLYLIRKGYPHKPLMAALLISAILGNYAGAYFGEGTNDFGFQSLIVMVFLVTIFFGEKWLTLLTALNISFIILLYFLEIGGLITFVDRAYSPLAGMTISVALATIIFLTLRSTIQQLVQSNEEMKLAKEEAERANHSKSLFLANMSHELRTPLHAILGYSELVGESLDEVNDLPREIQEDITRINQSGKHLLALITDLLDVSKAEADQLKIYNDWFNLNDFLQELENTLEPMIKENNNRFRIQNDIQNTKIFSDQVRLKQVLLNLLSNGTRFTKNGSVLLGISAMDQFVVFTVKDTGIGISPDMQKMIFLPFQQGDSSLSKLYQGTGLGLAISSKLVAQMGGDLHVTSQLGDGSSFTFELPALPKADIKNITDQTVLNESDATWADDLA